MTYVIDIDGTICSLTNGDYENAEPLSHRIQRVNELYEEGNTIIFQTARGMGRSKNSTAYANVKFFDLTKDQLDRWGVKYHQLFLGKPSGDLYIDDKGILADDFFTD